MCIIFVMKRLLLSSLIVLVLFTQWGLVLHAYQAHDDELVCELCLAANSHEHALVSAVSLNLLDHTHYLNTTALQQSLIQQTSRYYPARAPPVISTLQ